MLAIFYVDGVNAKSLKYIGEELTNFKLKTLQGKNIKIHSVIKDKIAVINFTTTWCSDCNKLAKVLSKIIPVYREKGVEFCYIYVGQKQKMVSHGIEKSEESSAPVRLLDEKRKAFSKLKLTSIPHLIVVDKEGVVRYEGLCLQEKGVVAEIEKVILGEYQTHR